MCIFHRVVEETGSNKTCRVSHIEHEDCADFVGNLANASIIPLARIGACTADDELRTLTTCNLLHHIIVDEIGIGSYVVFYRLEHEAGEIHRRTVRKVTSVREVETHKLVARLEHSHENSHISLCSRVGLYISPLSAKNLLEALDSDGFCLIDYLAAAIVAVTGIALGILVGKA